MSSLLKYPLFILLAGLAVGAPAAQDWPLDWPVPFEVTYSVYRKGAKIATMQRRFVRLEDGNYQYRSETNTTGLVALFRRDKIIEETTWKNNEEALFPLHYRYRHTGGKKERHVVVEFDWDKKTITNSINGAAWQMPTRARIMDKLLYQLAIMKDLKEGRRPLAYTIADGGKIKPYHFEVLGEEVIETPLGQFATIKLFRHKPGSRRQSTLWCAPRLHYLPVRLENIEKDGGKTMVEISALQGIAL